jgi:hypothetical protein
VNQIARFALLDTMPTKVRFGVLMKWTLTMFQHGVRAAKVTLKTAKCCAKPTIEQKVIGKMLKNMIWNYVDIKNYRLILSLL